MQQKVVAADDGKLMNRNSRKMLKNTNGGAKPPIPRASSASPSNVTTPGSTYNRGRSGSNSYTVNHTIDLTRAAPTETTEPVDPEESVLMKTIAVLQGAGKNADGTYVCQAKITSLSERLADAMLSKLGNI